MKKQTRSIHSRPHMDHLRGEAKALLAALATSDAAAQVFIDHHPAAGRMRIAQVRAAGFRLADAQFAVARKQGFASWPRLALYVEQLRALEGTWDFISLELDGAAIPAAMFSRSQLLMDGDRFCMRSPEADYEGVFSIDVEENPARIDIHFIAGPEAGNWSYGLYVLEGESLTLCLGLTGVERPAAFATAAGSGHALERLVRASKARPADLTVRPSSQVWAPANAEAGGDVDGSAFEFHADPVYDRLAGNWQAIEVVLNGQPLPAPMLSTARREGRRNETKVSFSGQVMIDARMRIDTRSTPMAIDYLHNSGAAKGRVQHGIMAWEDDDVRFCMAAPGAARPADFSCVAGSGRTMSRWRREQA